MNLSLFGRLAELAGLEVLGELVQNLGLVAEHHVQVLADQKARFDGVATGDGAANLLVLVHDVLIVENLVAARSQRKRSRSALVSSSHDHTVLRHAMLKIM